MTPEVLAGISPILTEKSSLAVVVCEVTSGPTPFTDSSMKGSAIFSEDDREGEFVANSVLNSLGNRAGGVLQSG